MKRTKNHLRPNSVFKLNDQTIKVIIIVLLASLYCESSAGPLLNYSCGLHELVRLATGLHVGDCGPDIIYYYSQPAADPQ